MSRSAHPRTKDLRAALRDRVAALRHVERELEKVREAIRVELALCAEPVLGDDSPRAACLHPLPCPLHAGAAGNVAAMAKMRGRQAAAARAGLEGCR